MKGEHRRVGVMGGTFDPIHYGHLAIAEAARRQFALERVVFVPTGTAPHKDNRHITPGFRRYEMALLAVGGNKYFETSNIEIERAGASYTSDTLAELRRAYGKKTPLYFIAGADAVSEMLTWKSPERIFELCSIAVAARAGAGELQKQAAMARERYGAKIYPLDAPLLDISSTEIRSRVQVGQPVGYLMPAAVEQYIGKFRLYRDDDYDMENAELSVGRRLSDKRWRHTMGVAGVAVGLAEAYGSSRRKAYVAAIFHDCAKEIPAPGKLKLCGEWGVGLDSITRGQPDLLHGALSAEIARREFNIDDPEILNAICSHTMGCEGMSLLDKILMVADCAEPNRGDSIDALDGVRGCMNTDLDKAVALCLRMKIDYTKSKGQAVHPLSLKSLEEAEKNEGRR